MARDNMIRQEENGFDIFIESKSFHFEIIDCNAVHVSKSKNGISSAINLDLARVKWLKDSIHKIFSGNRFCTRMELHKSLTIFYDANYFGGFVRIIERGYDSLFIPEGWNGHGINLFLSGLTKAITLMNSIASNIAIEQDSGEVVLDTRSMNLDFLPFDGDYPHSWDTELSISGALLQVDIDRFENRSLDLVTIEDVQNPLMIIEPEQTSDEFVQLKNFFHDTLTNGVDSLSHYLLCEFERLLTSTLGNLTMGSCNDGKTSEIENATEQKENSGGGIRSGHAHLGGVSRGNLSYVFDCDEFYGGPDSIISGDEFLGHVSENEKRVPFSTMEDLWDSDTNEIICQKALLVTPDNCLPTQNLNTQKRMYKKRNQRSHLMRTRSQTRAEL
ncbi:unnamed protein product [Cuscuta epithymum]|uniref:Uncharacterized protein n=1 Tax=Cuscuta epithymum TaxID=186058 RepID=A0AAV0DSB8_9ASTE|nr:unnamed protein product [Cuscuta epithymum]